MRQVIVVPCRDVAFSLYDTKNKTAEDFEEMGDLI